MVPEHAGDVLQRGVPADQFFGVRRSPRQRQGVMLVQPLVHLQNVSSGTVNLVRRLTARDQRAHVFVIQLQKSAPHTDRPAS